MSPKLTKHDGNNLESLDKQEEEMRRLEREERRQQLIEILAPIVAEKIAQQCTDAQIRAELKKLGYDNVSIGAFKQLKRQGYLTLMGVLDKTPEEFKAEALGLYDSVLRDPHAEDKDKINAQQRKDRLLGLESVRSTPLSTAEIRQLINDIDEAHETTDETN